MKKIVVLFALAASVWAQLPVPGGGGGGAAGGAGTANVSATSVGAVTSLAIDITSLNLTAAEVAKGLLQCWTGTGPYTPVAITNYSITGSAPATAITPTFSSTANITCRFNSSGATGPTGPAGAAGADGADGVFSEIASQAEAEAGTNNTKGMTPERVAQAIAALASETGAGVVFYGVFGDLPAASGYTNGLAIVTDCATTACSAGGGAIPVLLKDTGSAWSNAFLVTNIGGGSADVMSVLSAADFAAIRTLLSLVIGTNIQAYDADLTTYAGITPSANVQSLLGAADYAAIRTLLGLVIGTNVQAYDADLTTYAGITPSANVQSVLAAADYAAIRTALSLVVGTNVQAYDADLAAIAALSCSNDEIVKRAGGVWTCAADDGGGGGGATSLSGLTDLQVTVSGAVATVATGRVNIVVAGVPTTTSVATGTITKNSGTDTGTFYIYVTSGGALSCLRGAGITIGNYTVSSGLAGSTCPSGSAFPADSIPLATVDVSSGTLQTPVEQRALFSRDPTAVGAGLTKSGNTLSVDSTVVLVSPFTKNAQTSTYQVLSTDFDTCKTITVASGTFTITLVASGSQPVDGKCISIINYGSGVVTVARSGQNINGGTTSLTIPAATATAPTGAKIYSDGTNYFAALFGASSGGTPFAITDLFKFTTRWSMWRPGQLDDASSADVYNYGANCSNAGGFGANGQSLSSITPWLFKTTGGSDDQICLAYSPNPNNSNYGNGTYDFVSGATPLAWGVKGVVKIKDRNADYYYGRSTSTANFNNFVGLRALTTDTNWFCVIINGGSATTSDTGVAVVLSTGDSDGDTKLEVSNGAAVANDITCKVNGTSDTVAATIPTSFRSYDIWGGQQQGATASVWGVAQLAWWVNGIGAVE